MTDPYDLGARDAAAMRKLFAAFLIAQSVLGLIVLSCLVVVVMSALA